MPTVTLDLLSISIDMVAILFRPSARVYNLRILLLALVVDAVLGPLFSSWDGFNRHIIIFLIGSNAIFAVHHVVAVFRWSTPGLAVIDLVTVFLEIGVGLYVSIVTWAFAPIVIPQLLALTISALFRISTVIKTKEKLHHQRLAFLGCCTRSYPGYTPASILFNRSLARPLIRGESKIIIFARAAVISCIGFGIPAFGVYSIFIVPLLLPDIYTKSLVRSAIMGQLPSAPLKGNATVFLNPIATDGNQFSSELVSAQMDVSAVLLRSFQNTNCVASGTVFTCPNGWSDIQSLSVSVIIPPEIRGVSVRVSGWDSLLHDLYLDDETSIPTPLLPGSHLFGLITWSAKMLFRAAEAPYSGSPRWAYIPEINGLQQNLTVQPTGSGIATLTLFQPSTRPTRYQQEATDVSVLSGVSNLGGFWTFVNGAFTLLFGANVIYFGFGRRPLSALGVVHLFQRRSLVRQWHEDFPALHTEGGLPGSKSAGIVAFIRERLVDLGEGPRNGHDDPGDIEAPPLHHPTSHPSDSELLARNNQEIHEGSVESLPVTYLSKNAGYILEEIPL